MTVHLPQIGIPSCMRAISLLEEYPQNIVGSFWVMCGVYGFNNKPIPNWWIDMVSAQDIINGFKQGLFNGQYKNPLYVGFCIIVVADSSNPVHLSYVIETLRMLGAEGIELLRIMAQNNIVVETEVSYPQQFLNYRYGEENPNYQYLRETLDHWSIQVWEDYCSYLMSHHGREMFYDYCKKINAVKDEVQATVEKGTKLLVLTEGETDPIYIKTALALLGEKEILAQVDIEWVGISIDKGKSINTGDGGLKNTRDVLLSNPKFLTRKVLLIYDCDTDKSNENHELLKIRKIPQQKNRKVKKGIENLFPDHLFTEEFYLPKTKYGDYGEKNQIQEFQKMKFCKWICEQRKQADDFVDFKIIIEFIKDCLGTVTY
ncbi:hypothetical protein PN450_20105 [Dolichospermum lemmermannii CS-548]|uniref:hypothetical protein n=1 Tax=Dolichospermum lemmermannii TaxID=54295 RepID=UPI00232B9A0D|nr:hypothetical protein [Dolichospermum lemmermannii]MDB9439046.1 hypothetical protein [Dolichospermum lemmermannii CS-548]